MPLSPHGALLSTILLGFSLAGVVPAHASPTPDDAGAPAPSGSFVWSDPPPPPAPPARPAAGRASAAEVLDRSGGDVLALHSLPGSQHTILIDFNGQAVSGTFWNDQGVTAGVSPGWDPSGNGVNVLSASESAWITEIWSRVAEDFAPFDVDVTTADPGAAAITRDSPVDPTYGVRVLVTNDPSARAAIDTCAGGCGGVAFNDVFDTFTDHARYQPAWVFPQALSNDPKYIAEAVSHEVGHTFGLAHDDRSGDAENGYYSGHAPWAPIMGSGYLQPVTQWSRGSFVGSLNLQDDLAIIAAGGAPLRPDEGSTLPAPDATSYISSAADVDVYLLPGCAGSVDVDADVAAFGPNLDLELRLLQVDETQLAMVDPLSQAAGKAATGLDAELVHSLPAAPANYLLVVDGSGRDGTTPTTGYDDYGSVGAYRLTVSGCGITLGAPGAPGVPSVAFSATTARLTWTAPADVGDSPVTGYRVLVDGVPKTTVNALTATVAGLARGRSYQFSVAAVNTQGSGLVATRTASVPIALPGPPRVGKVAPGAPGGPVTAALTWQAPVSDGGAKISQYRFTAYRLDKKGRVVATLTTGAVPGVYRKVDLRLPQAGPYRFALAARNAAGWGPLSARSGKVTAR